MEALAIVGSDALPRSSARANFMLGDEASLSDEQLLRLCAEGESPALRELVRRHQAPLYRFLYRLMGSEEDAEEAVSDVFVRAWRNAARFQYRAKVGTWLYRIAVNIARDAHSRKKSRPREVWIEANEVRHLSSGSAEEEAIRSVHRGEMSVALKKALANLSADDRLILVMYYLEDAEYAEIQAVTGLSYPVLKTRLARARKRLRHWMEREIQEASR
jgi:RNA polymerase sigma-70 factor (ECF subfamily)